MKEEQSEEQEDASDAVVPEETLILRDSSGTQAEPAGIARSTQPITTPNTGQQQKPREDRAAPGHVFAGRFVVESLLGEGGMGRVYLASDRQVDGRKVALKVLLAELSENEAFRSLFFSEIDAATRFVSEHVVQVRDTGQLDDGMLFLTMDYVEGEALDAIVRREGTFSTRHALEVTRQTLLGLGSGHAKGYVHRDLKPSNIMLVSRTPKTEENPFGVDLRLLDFGIAGIAAELDHKKLMGTPTYMSPEQHMGEAIDLRSDLFSVGVVLYEMLTGERPFQGKTLRELATDVLEADVQANLEKFDQIPKSVRGLLQKALAKKRDQRFQSTDEFVQAIERSKAYRAVGKSPALVNVIAVAAVIGVLAQGAYIASSRVGTVEAQVSELTVQGQVDKVIESRLEDQATQMRAEFAKEKTNLTLEITQLTSANGVLQSANSSLDASLGDEQVVSARLKADAKEQSTALGLARTEGLIKDKANAELELKNQGLTSQLLRYQYQSRQEVIDALAFDQVTDFLRQGDYRSASSRHDTALLTPASMLQPSQEKGGIFLTDIVAGFSALEGLVSSGGADAEFLVEARRRLAAASKRASLFSSVATGWVQFATSEGEAAPDRQAIAEELVALLESELDLAQTLLDSTHNGELKALMVDVVACAPSDAISHSLIHGCEDASLILVAYAERLETRLVRTDDSLDLESLGSFPNLQEWGHVLLSNATASLTIDSKARATVLEFAVARAWYADGQRIGAVPAAPISSAESGGQELASWRTKLRLQQQIIAGGNDGNPYLRVPLAFYRSPDVRGQDLWSRVEPGAHAPGSLEWLVKSTTLGSLSRERESKISLDGTRLRLFNSVLCDLASLEGVEVASWAGPQIATSSIAGDPSLPPQVKLDRFFATLSESPLQCLVLRTAEQTLWLSPEVGLVRLERDGKTLQELIYFDR